jgi:hypothetical protein
MATAAPVAKPESWGRLVNEVAHRVLLRAATMPPRLQAWVSKFNIACQDSLECLLFADDRYTLPLRRNLASLTLEDLQHVYATLFFAYFALQKAAFPEEDWGSPGPLMSLPESIYHQPKSYTDRWVQFIFENRSNPHSVGRISYRINDEVNPILGIDKADAFTGLSWPNVLNHLGKILQTPDSEQFVAAARTDIQNVLRSERCQPSGCSTAVLAVVVCLFWLMAQALAF